MSRETNTQTRPRSGDGPRNERAQSKASLGSSAGASSTARLIAALLLRALLPLSIYSPPIRGDGSSGQGGRGQRLGKGDAYTVRPSTRPPRAMDSARRAGSRQCEWESDPARKSARRVVEIGNEEIIAAGLAPGKMVAQEMNATVSVTQVLTWRRVPCELDGTLVVGCRTRAIKERVP